MGLRGSRTGLVVTLRIQGVRETLRVLSLLPKEASSELRKASERVADGLAGRIRSAAAGQGSQAAALARTVKARRDRVPTVQAGGTTRIGRRRAPAYRLLFASEFGMNRRSGWYANPRYSGSTGRQYRPHRGREGYWFFPTAEADQPRIDREWNTAADAVVDRWSRS